jgi:hypothetical protein
MPTPTPIFDALKLVRAAIFTALDPLTVSPVAWQQADEGVEPPFCVFFSQDAGGTAAEYLDGIGWSGLITVKAIAASQSAAEVLLTAVTPGMDSLAVAGRAISARYVRPIAIPPDDSGRWQSASQWRVFLF